jgi:hypothetical protein
LSVRLEPTSERSALHGQPEVIGMDVHKEAISVAVLNFSGKLAMECTIETKVITVLDFLEGLN